MRSPRPPRVTVVPAPVGYAEVVQGLRAKILAGHWQPGQQLPPWAELQTTFGITPVTLHRAVQVLIADGFLRTRARAGTFVVDRPPHLTRYGLVFWNDPAGPQQVTRWSRYHAALTQAAAGLQASDGRSVQLFHDIDHHTDTADRRLLERELTAHRLAGLIFVNIPHGLEGSALLDSPGLPRVVLSTSSPAPHIHALRYNNDQWLDHAVSCLAEQGRRRLAVLVSSIDRALLRRLATVFARHGLTLVPHWVQGVDALQPMSISHCVQLLFAAAPEVRPDGLMVLDDNMAEAVVEGLQAAQLTAPTDMALVVHCNFPWGPPLAVPATRLGFDIPRALRAAIDVIDRERRGERVPHTLTQPAVFEHELAAAGTARTGKPQRTLA